MDEETITSVLLKDQYRSFGQIIQGRTGLLSSIRQNAFLFILSFYLLSAVSCENTKQDLSPKRVLQTVNTTHYKRWFQAIISQCWA